jgi:chromosomal replication initiation ATPase DnaA
VNLFARLIAQAHAGVQEIREQKGLAPWNFEERQPFTPERVMDRLLEESSGEADSKAAQRDVREVEEEVMSEVQRRLWRIEQAIGIIRTEVRCLRQQTGLIAKVGERRMLSTESVIAAIEYVYRIPVEDLFTQRDHSRARVEPRHVTLYMLHEVQRLGLADIGRKFGMHHTSVMHAVNSIRQRIGNDAGLAAKVEEIKNALDDFRPVSPERATAEIARQA